MNDVITGLGTNEKDDPLVFCGLTKKNVDGLLKGEPIRVPADRLRELGLDPAVEIVIGYAEDQATILALLEGHMPAGSKSS